MDILNKQLRDGKNQEAQLKSTLASLCPFIDSTGLLRAGGRLSNATNLSFDYKYPKILPKDEKNVEALIREEHKNQGHAGTNHIWSTLSQSYWIINGRQSVKRVIQGCVPCQKNFKQPGHQKMADLPADRVDGCAPFEATAMDAFGPFSVKNGGRRNDGFYFLPVYPLAVYISSYFGICHRQLSSTPLCVFMVAARAYAFCTQIKPQIFAVVSAN